MFDERSRYFGLEAATFTGADGRSIRYVRRRWVPPAGALSPMQRVTVTDGDRLDRIAAGTLGDPEQYWRICDANDVLHPGELTREVGRVLTVPVPGAEKVR